MEIRIKELTPWEVPASLARRTMWKEGLGHEPSSDWKSRIILAAHSPIYSKFYQVDWDGLPRWIADEFVRHHVGATPYMSSQRPDRSPDATPRSERRQTDPVNLSMVLNAQSFLDISRKRLCRQAAPEARETWARTLEVLKEIGEVELYDHCVPECVHQGGFCPEMKCCGMCPPNNGRTVMMWKKLKGELPPDNAIGR